MHSMNTTFDSHKYLGVVLIFFNINPLNICKLTRRIHYRIQHALMLLEKKLTNFNTFRKIDPIVSTDTIFVRYSLFPLYVRG